MEKIVNILTDSPCCPLCENEATVFFAKKNNINIYKCQKCKFVFVFPEIKDLAKIYNSDYFHGGKGDFGYADYDGDKKNLLENFKKYTDKIELFSKKKGKLLDVGAATGIFVESVNDRGWDAQGIDISLDATLLGKNKQLKLMTGEFEDYNFGNDFFDVITFWDVLEHFPHPEKALKKADKILKKNGIIAINTPNASSVVAKIFGKKWHLLVPPEHLNYFSPGNIESILSKNGFTVLYIGRIRKKFSLQYIFKILSRWQKFSLWKWIYSYLSKNRLGKINLTIDTSDNMFIIAKKN